MPSGWILMHNSPSAKHLAAYAVVEASLVVRKVAKTVSNWPTTVIMLPAVMLWARRGALDTIIKCFIASVLSVWASGFERAVPA